MNTDILIIGGGPGGYEAAVHAAKAGKSVVLIEEKELGGTCLHAGCIPTKCLCRNAEVLDDLHEAARFGIETGTVSFDLAKAVARKDEVVRKLTGGIEMLMRTPGITVVKGKARFADAHTVSVETSEGGSETCTASHILIATGSVTKFLPIEGAHSPGVVTSTEMLNLQAVPQRLCVIGGGVIGLEFASIFRSFGTEVTVVEYCKEILPQFDRDIAKRLRTSLKKRGIAFKTGAAVTAVRYDEASRTSTVLYSEKGKEASTEADLVLMAVGRAANVDSLNLADVGIDFTPRGITVDENMQTNVPGIYAIGDVNGRCQLAHAATFQGFRAVNHILGQEDHIRLDIVPAAVFTVPEAATVGLSEEACTERGIEYTVHKAFYRANGKALAMEADDGMAKIVCDANGQVLGAHILGAHAADLIHEVSNLMNAGISIDRLADCIHAHPSLNEILLSAARTH